MNRNILFIIPFILLGFLAQAQDEEKKEDKTPVKKPWEGTLLIESQTTKTASKGGLELIIHHRMGALSDGIGKLYGIYGASNIRLGLQYGITNSLTIGIGTEKNNVLTDFNAKYIIVEQTKDNSIPVTVTGFGLIAVDGREKEMVAKEFSFSDRLSYFGQILASRKFNNNLSLQAGVSYGHFNAVDSVWQHDRIGIMAGGRFKITKLMGLLFEYSHPIAINKVRDYQNDSNAGIAFGMEIGTGTHAFQLFATNYNHIVPQKNLVMNPNKFDGDGIGIGFNVTVRF